MAVPYVFTNRSGQIPLSELDANFAAVPTSSDLSASTGSTLIGTIQSGTGAVTRTVDAKLKETVSVKDFGAVGDWNGSIGTDNYSAFQLAYGYASSGDTILIPNGIYYLSSAITGTKFVTWLAEGQTSYGGNWDLPGIVEHNYTSRKIFEKLRTNVNDYASVEFKRSTTHAGGTSEYVSSNVLVNTIVNAGATNFEWGFLSKLNNATSGAGENVAIYGQAIKTISNASPTWAACFEARNSTNPTAGEAGGQLVGLEVDIFSNGTAGASDRVIIDAVAGKATATGLACQVSHGIRISAQAGQGSFINGLSIPSPCVTAINLTGGCSESVIKISGDSPIGISLSGTFVTCLDTSNASLTGPAIRVARDQYYAFEGTSTIRMSLPSGGPTSVIQFLNGTAEFFGINYLDSTLRLNGVKVVSPRILGWASPTGTATKTTFATSTVTLSILAEHVKALIDDLTSHGLIGN